jgi:hypothetical protein
MEPPRVDPPRVEQPRVEPPRVEQPRFEPLRMEPPRVDPPQFEQPRVEPPRFEPPRMEPPRFEPQRVDPPQFEQPRMEPPRMEPLRMEQPWFEQLRMEPPRFEQPRMEPLRFEPRMEPPWMGPPPFGFPRAKPYQGQPEGFRGEPPQRFEPYREQVRFEQPYEFRNEPYIPPQNRRNRPRNDHNGQNFPEEDIFDRGINLEERNRDIGPEPNPRPVQGQDLRDTIFEVLDQAFPGQKRTPRHPYKKLYPERIDREGWPRGFKISDFTMFSGENEKTALEHISRFIVQCGEYSNNGNGKLRMFPNSLTGQAFTWYAALPTNSIESWEEMEEKF